MDTLFYIIPKKNHYELLYWFTEILDFNAEFLYVFINRPGIAGAFLQTPWSIFYYFIKSVSHPFPSILLVYTTKLLKLNRCHLCHLRGVFMQES